MTAKQPPTIILSPRVDNSAQNALAEEEVYVENNDYETIKRAVSTEMGFIGVRIPRLNLWVITFIHILIQYVFILTAYCSLIGAGGMPQIMGNWAPYAVAAFVLLDVILLIVISTLSPPVDTVFTRDINSNRKPNESKMSSDIWKYAFSRELIRQLSHVTVEVAWYVMHIMCNTIFVIFYFIWQGQYDFNMNFNPAANPGSLSTQQAQTSIYIAMNLLLVGFFMLCNNLFANMIMVGVYVQTIRTKNERERV